MASVIQQLTKRQLIKPPKFLPSNVHYEVLTGSVAYGVSSDTSDMDASDNGSTGNSAKGE